MKGLQTETEKSAVVAVVAAVIAVAVAVAANHKFLSIKSVCTLF